MGAMVGRRGACVSDDGVALIMVGVGWGVVMVRMLMGRSVDA